MVNEKKLVKIGLAQINVTPGQPEINTKSIVDIIKQAKKSAVDIVVFPELGVPGYLLSDLWEDATFVKNSFLQNKKIEEASNDINVIFGNVLPDFRRSLFNKERSEYGNDGRTKKYNAAYVFSHGKPAKQTKEIPTFEGKELFPVKGVTIKTNQPHYREFEDARHFVSFKELSQQTNLNLEQLLQPFELKTNNSRNSIKAGVLICEDVWISDYVYHGKTLDPARILVENGAEIIFAISTSPYGWRKNIAREKNINKVQEELARAGKPTPLVYLNPVGIQNNGKNEYVLDGRSAIYEVNGKKILEAPLFKEGLFTYTLEIPTKTASNNITLVKNEDHLTKKEIREELHQALIYGLKEFCKQKDIENLVIGLSGGIDSALVAYLAQQALGKDHVLAINMPTKFNSDWTKSVAKYIAKRLGIAYQMVPIEDIANTVREKLTEVEFNGIFGEYGPGFKNRTVDENIQARIRSADILSGIAAKYPKTVYTCNGNKTEILLGWFTLDGDGRGAICPIADLYKTQIIELAAHINEQAISCNEKVVFPWELIAPLFDYENYLEENETYREIIPSKTKTLVPSAELSEEHDVNKNKGDPIIFTYHDALLRQLVEYRKNPMEIIKIYEKKGIKGLASFLEIKENRLDQIFKDNFKDKESWLQDIWKIWRLFHSAVYKQIQSPPILSISKRALGYDFRRSQLKAFIPTESM